MTEECSRMSFLVGSSGIHISKKDLENFPLADYKNINQETQLIFLTADRHMHRDKPQDNTPTASTEKEETQKKGVTGSTGIRPRPPAADRDGIFQNPVVLQCSHSFCKECLKRRWSHTWPKTCPICKKRSPKGDPPCNLALKNLCDAVTLNPFRKEMTPAQPETFCSLHSEKLKLFCFDHQQPVCVVCRDSRAHTNHRFSPLDEAADDYKKELRQHLQTLQEKKRHCTRVQLNWDEAIKHIQDQTQTTESQIREKFKKLQYFLNKEEEARVNALRREEEEKCRVMKAKILTLSRQIDSLSDTIKATEEELQSGSITFLHNYKAAVEKAKQCSLVEDPQLGSGALIDVAKHLGNLTFNVWNEMKEIVTYSPVILDPNTAGMNLFVFDDLRHLIYVEKKSLLPMNPERFQKYPMVLGSEGFDSGTHSWDVEVKSDADWAVGVIRESKPRKGGSLTGYWEMRFHGGEYKAYSPPVTDEFLSVQKRLQRIRVQLDWDKGKLSFYDKDTNTHLYTFYQAFSERVFPFINTLYTKPLCILPQKFTVQLGT
ncbi:tripartite motif-containing protein 35-like [Xyrichtys novacula]|uniref:Tripartite motif-containing protein 35-like n=1 Tax=Xyrichtys novacula TaxID=13765 RepID=A0AAV1HQB6_XYRNO|nr:tripartite motif-containing protein 35-like [Xyrichtys novacula]